MPRPPNTQARRAEIVLALRRVMARTGYERATIAMIGREASLSPGLVHYHFASKLEILLALAARLAAEADARAAAAGGDTARERLIAWLDAQVTHGEDAEAAACWVEIGAEALHQPEVAEVWRAVIAARVEALAARVRDVQRAEAIPRPADPHHVAAALIAAVEGAWRLGVGAPAAVPRAFAARALRAMADGLIGPAPAIQRPIGAPTAPDDWAIWR